MEYSDPSEGVCALRFALFSESLGASGQDYTAVSSASFIILVKSLAELVGGMLLGVPSPGLLIILEASFAYLVTNYSGLIALPIRNDRVHGPSCGRKQ